MRNEHRNEPIDRALDQIRMREWRTPDLERITSRKEKTMFSGNKTRSRIAIGAGIVLIAGGAAFGGAFALGVFSGTIVSEDGQEYDVELQQIGKGVYEGSTSDGHNVRFMTEKALNDPNMKVLFTSPENATFTVSPDDINGAWTQTEEADEATDPENAEGDPHQ